MKQNRKHRKDMNTELSHREVTRKSEWHTGVCHHQFLACLVHPASLTTTVTLNIEKCRQLWNIDEQKEKHHISAKQPERSEALCPGFAELILLLPYPVCGINKNSQCHSRKKRKQPGVDQDSTSIVELNATDDPLICLFPCDTDNSEQIILWKWLSLHVLDAGSQKEVEYKMS